MTVGRSYKVSGQRQAELCELDSSLLHNYRPARAAEWDYVSKHKCIHKNEMKLKMLNAILF